MKATFISTILLLPLLVHDGMAEDKALLRIGVSLGTTGAYEEPARMQKQGYQIWEKHVNESGGILGRQVQMLFADDLSESAEAKKIYQNWLSEGEVDLVFGPYSSQITFAVAPILDEGGYPTIVPGAAADRIWTQGYSNIFGLFSPASNYSIEMIRLAPFIGLEKLAIVRADDEFSVAVAEGTMEWAEEAGVPVVLQEEIKKGVDASGLVPVATAVEAANPDLLIVAGHFDESVNMRKALDLVGWYPGAYFATVGPTLDEYRVELGSDLAECTLAPSLWEPDESIEFPGSRELIAGFREEFGDERRPTYHAATAYSAGQVIKKAIEAAGDLDHNKIRKALYELDTPTAIGRFRVDRLGIPVKHRPLLIQWIDGRKVIIGSPETIKHCENR